MTVQFFDAYTCIGPRPRKHPAHGWRLEDILAELRHCSIAGALVASQLSVNYDAMFSNRQLSEALAPYPHLFPIWNVLPHHTGECPEPEALRAMLREHDVRAVTLSPAANAWDLLSPCNAALLEMLQRARLLTILRQDQIGDFGKLETLLGRYPDLPVAVAQAYWTNQRIYTPLLTAYKNLHLMTSHYQAHYGLEMLVELGCEDQILYSSSAPEMSMGAHRTYLDYAQLPEATVAKIAGGNLARLLGGQAPPPAEVNPDEDSLMRAARHGQPLPAMVVDFHVHILHEGLHGGGGANVMRDGGPHGVLPQLQRLGYDAAGIMSWGVVSGDAVGGNEATRQALDVFPESYWGLASFDPSHYTPQEIAVQLEEAFADRRFRGVKPYPVFGLRYDDERYRQVWEFAEAHGLYVLVHRTTNDFSELEALAPRYPHVAWVVAHCGSDYGTADQAIACMKKHPNVYAELTLTPVTQGIVEYLVDAVGADRVLYGSDLPMRDPRQQLGWVVYAHLPEVDKRKIIGENALRILGTACPTLGE